MPSPFPGMGPYLEHPAVFPGLHNRLIVVLSELLQAALPAPYYAEIGERVWVEVSQRFIEPDGIVLRPDTGPTGGRAGRNGRTPGYRPMVAACPTRSSASRSWKSSLLVRALERLVTAIEFLSPSNKTPGERGRELYLRKQRDTRQPGAPGRDRFAPRGRSHDGGAARTAPSQVGPFDYHESVHRSDRFEDYLVYPIRLEERLPAIGIPLLHDDPDVPLDLQALLDRIYDNGPYRHRIRYAEAVPVPPLRPDQAAWAAAVIQGMESSMG